jgi:hypothetical protein
VKQPRPKEHPDPLLDIAYGKIGGFSALQTEGIFDRTSIYQRRKKIVSTLIGCAAGAALYIGLDAHPSQRAVDGAKKGLEQLPACQAGEIPIDSHKVDSSDGFAQRFTCGNNTLTMTPNGVDWISTMDRTRSIADQHTHLPNEIDDLLYLGFVTGLGAAGGAVIGGAGSTPREPENAPVTV